MKPAYITAAIIVLMAAVAFSQAAPQASSWWGRVTINSTASANATVLADNGTGNLSTTVGAYASNLYLTDVGCSNGTTVKLRVFDLSAQNVTCLPGAKTELNLSVSTASNGFVCNYGSSCSSGFCTDGYCCNSACGGSSEDCNVAGALGTCTSTATTPSGGGGGGSSGAAPATKPSETQSVVGTLSAGATASVSFTTSGVAVSKVEITVSEAVASVSVTVKETSKPASASVAIETSAGTVYKYLDITPTVTNDKIASAKITFKVPKSWFTANTIDPATVVLKKNVGTAWTDLATSQSGSDATNYIYTATTTSFSVYAVTGEKVAQAQPAPNGTAPAPGEPAPGAPSLTILSPQNGATIAGSTITVRLAAQNINLVPAGGTVNDGEGHFHVYLDGGQEQRGAQTEFTFANVARGAHTIRAELHRNDHAAFDPPVVREIGVTMVEAAETPSFDMTTLAMLIGVLIGVLIVVLAGAYVYYGRTRPKPVLHKVE